MKQFFALCLAALASSAFAQLPPFPRAGSEYGVATALERGGSVLAVDYVRVYVGEAGCARGIREGAYKSRADCEFLEFSGFDVVNTNPQLRRFLLDNTVSYRVLTFRNDDWVLRSVTAEQFRLLLRGQNSALRAQIGEFYATGKMPGTLIELRFRNGKLFEIQQVYLP